jgi:integrase
VRRPKGEGSVLKVKGCRFWYAQYVHNGKQVRTSTRETSKMKALGVLRRLMGDRDRGLASLPEAQKLKYADLRRGLLANYMERGNRSLTTNADGEETINGLKQLDEFFGFGPDNPGPPLTQITTETSREFARKRQAQGAGTAMVNRSLACLRRMLHIAHEDGRIQNVPKIRFLKEPPARKGFLELENFENLVNLMPTHLRPLITFLYYCGVRVGEALQIEWPQVDLDARLIRLEEDQTKNAEARTVPLPAVLVMMLAEIKPKTGRVFSDTNLRTEWQKASAASGLGTRTLIEPEDEDAYPWYKYTGLLIHDLRRSAVRNLVNAGVPERVAMKISGHKTRAVFDRYHIVSTDDVTNAMRRLELNGAAVSERLVKKPAESVRRLPVSRTK